MSSEQYIFDVGENGATGLDILDYCFNPNTQAFLLDNGLKSNINVLDIGCGSGVMTCWIAQQIGSNGRVVAIENNVNQLEAAQRRAEKLQLHNIDFKLCSAYEIDSLNQEFDLVYCRFVLHHLHHPEDVITKIFKILKTNGIYVAEEGIVNFAFSYPFSVVWGNEYLRLPPPWVDIDEKQRDGNLGIKLFKKLQKTGFQIKATKINHPILSTTDEKKLLLLGRDEKKRDYLSQGHSEDEWIASEKEIERIVNDKTCIIGFYASCQVAGLKI